MSGDSSKSSSAGPCGRAHGIAFGRSLLLWAALAVALVVAFVLDGPVMGAVAPLQGSSLADFLKNTVRWLGIGYLQVAVLLVLIAAGALLRPRALEAGVWGLLSFATAGVVATVLKVLVHRPRPWTEASPAGWSDLLHNSDLHSFPSGESTTTFAVAVALGSWYPGWRVPLLLVASAVAAARVLVGSHHPSDVVAGALLGVAVAQLVRRLADRTRERGSAAGT